MSYILSVYSRKAFKEYLLPAVNNADYCLNMKRDIFGLSEDFELLMEIMDGKWSFQKVEGLDLHYTATKKEYEEETIKDGDVFSLITREGEKISIIVKETDTSFAVYEKFSLENVDEITFGKEADSALCYDFLGLVSNKHGKMIRRGEYFILEDSSSNGIFVNAKRIVGSKQLEFGDCIDIFGLRIVYFHHFIAINTLIQQLKIREGKLSLYENKTERKDRERFHGKKSVFHRSPRNIPKIEKEKIEIEAPPSAREMNLQSAIMSIGPSMTMALPMLVGCLLSAYSTRASGSNSGVFMYTGLVTAVGSALIGSVWSMVNMRQVRKKNREDELKRFESYSEYLIRCTNDIKAKYENNQKGMQQLYPDTEACCQYNSDSAQLWNRNIRHEDYLFQRLGIGALPFQVEIDVPKARFSLTNDSLSEKPRMIKESYRLLYDVPICIDLMEHKLVGIIGGEEKRGCCQIMQVLAAQIAANNCYTDVKLAFVFDEDDSGDNWEFARWLPHVWTEDKKTRLIAGNKNDASEIFYEITKVLRMRAEERSTSSSLKKEVYKPHYILFLEKPELLEGELISKYLYEENDYGITTIFMADRYENLPNTCEYIVENTENFQGMYRITDGPDERIKIRYDQISAETLAAFARRLASIEVSEMETGGEIPNVLTFFDMYGIQSPEELDVLERWKKNRTYESIKALVGQKAGGADCYLDVHEKYHGPHGLVAGTTGSGKSETLQTYMLSLAINYSPDDIGFFVIDYKGGGMANLFEGLPHMIGQISNLSGNQVRRAMVSIKSENLRRQRIFNEHGVNNINLYTRLYKNNEATLPVPHMFIIIDEFAELKREEPDFMRELISVAQVGRSLGVHLILATQKPSGTVDDNIWSNSKFRLCLRVQDRQDSTDMLHRPDAAYITQAGRCYLQVGNDEIFELFQSAWSGAVYDEATGTVSTDIAKMLSETGKASLVGSHAKIKKKEKAKTLWVSLLLDMLQEAAGEVPCRLEECQQDVVLKNAVTDHFFAIAEKRELDYPNTDYNFHRIQDLIDLYISIGGKDKANADEGLQSEEARIMVEAAVSGKKLPEMKEKTQLDAVVEYLGKMAQSNGYVHNLQLWLPVLPEILYLNQLAGYEKRSFSNGSWKETGKGFTLEAIVGMYDDPVNQSQGSFSINLATDGNHAIVGTVVSGKSTFLMTYVYSLVNRYTPDQLNIYILDYSSKMLGAFAGLAHVGGVIYEEEGEKAAKFFTMLEGILEERKRMFKGGSYSQYVRANGITVPAVLILIDGMASFRSKTSSGYDDTLITLLKEGVNYGIYLVVTAAGFGISEIPNRMGDHFRTTICLEMKDKYAYTEALRTMHLDVLPEENVKGRGLAKIGETILEFQTALSLQAEDDFKRGEQVQQRVEMLNRAWTGKVAKPIPEIPKDPNWKEFSGLEEAVKMAEEGVRLPVGYDRKYATVYGIDLRRTYCYMVSGKSRTGKTNFLRLLTLSAAIAGAQVTVIDFAGELRAVANEAKAGYVQSPKEMYDFFIRITPDFKARNAAKKGYVEKGLSNEEMYDRMQQFNKLVIVIGDLTEFVDKVHRPGEGVGEMAPFLGTILDKGAMHNVFWFAGINPDEAVKVAGLNTYNLFIRDKNGMHLGGNVAAQRLMNFDHIPYTEQGKTLKAGIALLPANDEEQARAVVLPQYRAE
ncbi:MAG: type VII secretion protein EssC [Lachnospiraceae bacterium]|nr:type VII secretion protein EssC [Lachnospiraceae bacterium]